MKKKNGNLLNYVVMLAVLLAISSVVFAIKILTDKKEANVADSAIRVEGLSTKNNDEASIIYNRVMSYDLDMVYPQTVEDVMRLYNDTVYLLYGDMIIDSGLTEQILKQQRKLCNDELIGNLGFDEQLINLQASTGVLKEQNIICVGINEKMVKYDSDNRRVCTISVTSSFTKGYTVYRNYTLFLNDSKNRWEIYSWEKTDESFSTIIS